MRERGVELTGGRVAKSVAAPEVGNGWKGFFIFFLFLFVFSSDQKSEEKGIRSTVLPTLDFLVLD
jgi:hypothetical protein